MNVKIKSKSIRRKKSPAPSIKCALWCEEQKKLSKRISKSNKIKKNTRRKNKRRKNTRRKNTRRKNTRRKNTRRYYSKKKILTNIRNKDKKYALFSYYVGKPLDKRIKIKSNYILNTLYSNKYHSTYINKKKKHIIISFRGTKECSDWITNIYHVFSKIKNSKRLEDELKFVKDIKKLFKGYNITYTGHNLGGSISCEMVKKFKKDNAIVFNSAHGPFNSSYNHLKIIYYVFRIISYYYTHL